jgi:hypothetical protein
MYAVFQKDTTQLRGLQEKGIFLTDEDYAEKDFEGKGIRTDYEALRKKKLARKQLKKRIKRARQRKSKRR